MSITGGNPTYEIKWEGPSDGSATTDNTSFVISEIPSGDYTITLTDANGCTDVEHFTLNNGEGVQITVIPTDGDCYQQGSMLINTADDRTLKFASKHLGFVASTNLVIVYR